MRRLLYAFTLVFLIGCALAFWAYQRIYGFALNSSASGEIEIVIDESVEDQESLAAILKPHLRSERQFKRVSSWMRFNRPKQGYYLLSDQVKMIELIRILRSGMQTPVRLSFLKARSLEDLSVKLCARISADSSNFLNLIKSAGFREEYAVTEEALLGRFIPNTYEIWWTTNEEALASRMNEEYLRFWNEGRKKKAKTLDLNKNEVMTLASIVEEETNRSEEKSRVAGVYLNRLRRSWPLEADPTLKFALGDFGLKRILNIHKEVESPYNTYKNQGLPPGPICTPSINSIDAVLNAENHSYMFFCARPDFSGYHNFAVTLREHNINARNYHDALNRLNIK